MQRRDLIKEFQGVVERDDKMDLADLARALRKAARDSEIDVTPAPAKAAK